MSFFGLGNETPKNPDVDYSVRHQELVARPMLDFSLFGPLHARPGVELKRVTGQEAATFVSGELDLVADTRTGVLTAQRGWRLFASARQSLSSEFTFEKLKAEASALTGAGPVLLELRAKGEKNFGSFPYYEAAFADLRGYDLNRFAGDAAVSGTAEVRVELGRKNAIMPMHYGLLALGDAGRVFVDGESSSKWHAAYGGGVWLGMLAGGAGFQLASSMNAVVVRSDERTSFYLTSGFGL
jgi:hypothetical protein